MTTAILTPQASFTRPDNTTAYQSTDLMANSATAGSVTPLSFTLPGNSVENCYLRRVRIDKSGTGVTTCTIRVHFYTASPTVANGDNSAFSTNKAANYLGAVDVVVDRAFTDGAFGSGVPVVGNEINFLAPTTIYALCECRSSYTPGALEVFTITPEIHRY